MHDNRTHPLLEQVPLTVSPFVKLPTATTLPYTYKTMPNSLPPSAVGITATSDAADGVTQKPKYVISQTGHAAHPDDIMASCRALQAHIAKLQADAEVELRALDQRIRARELAEKRKLAPGWLDSDARLLEPERKNTVPNVSEAPTDAEVHGVSMVPSQIHFSDGGGGSGYGGYHGHHHGQGDNGHHGHGHPGGVSEMAVPDEGEELDRAFGGLGLGQRT
ncbi:hypothetical protein B0H66DRAFT_551370 [Apodospora peruviana]|uniref:Uncharacterized protein n=1 Tax=Apodospora peruviana TaxID=516989 RepID=A0AAE0MCF9_9PEZI|nr:hypothetical protein B0H66DRAFT_551370 [Apodospora peruviana]